MNKQQLIDAIAEQEHLTKATVSTVLDALAGNVANELAAGNEITLHDLGKLSVKQRGARKGRNPSTGEAIDIPAKKVVDFAPFKPLRDAVNS